MQQGVLDQVMSAPWPSGSSTRRASPPDPKEAFTLPELYDTLQALDLERAQERARDHADAPQPAARAPARAWSDALVKPQPTLPADARSLLRMDAVALAADIRHAQAKPGLSKETRAHLAESLETLEQALKAPMQRAGSVGRLATRRRSPSEEISFKPVDNARLAALCGPLDANLRQIETALDVTIARRGERFAVTGERDKAAQAVQALRRFYGEAASRPRGRGHPAGPGRDRPPAPRRRQGSARRS